MWSDGCLPKLVLEHTAERGTGLILFPWPFPDARIENINSESSSNHPSAVINIMVYLQQLKKVDIIGIEGPLCILSWALSPLFFPKDTYKTEFTAYHSHECFYTSALHFCSHKQYCFTVVKTWYQYVFLLTSWLSSLTCFRVVPMLIHVALTYFYWSIIFHCLSIPQLIYLFF